MNYVTDIYAIYRITHVYMMFYCTDWPANLNPLPLNLYFHFHFFLLHSDQPNKIQDGGRAPS